MHTSHTTRAWKNRLYTACHPKKTTTYIFHAVPITTHTHDRRKSIGKKDQRKKRYRKKKKEKEAKNEKGEEREEKKRKARKDKARRGSKAKGKEKRKNVILANPRT